MLHAEIYIQKQNTSTAIENEITDPLKIVLILRVNESHESLLRIQMKDVLGLLDHC